jgi:hypothetical protein
MIKVVILICIIILVNACSSDMYVDRKYEITYKSGERIIVQYPLCYSEFHNKYNHRTFAVHCNEKRLYHLTPVFTTTEVRTFGMIED